MELHSHFWSPQIYNLIAVIIIIIFSAGGCLGTDFIFLLRPLGSIKLDVDKLSTQHQITYVIQQYKQ